MAIDVQDEQVVSLRAACDLLPRRRAGRKTAIETLYRWTLHGCRGVKLESVQVGGTRCTSVEALQRFCDALTAAAGTSAAPVVQAVDRRRRAEIAAAERICNAAGI